MHILCISLHYTGVGYYIVYSCTGLSTTFYRIDEIGSTLSIFIHHRWRRRDGTKQHNYERKTFIFCSNRTIWFFVMLGNAKRHPNSTQR